MLINKNDASRMISTISFTYGLNIGKRIHVVDNSDKRR